MKIFGIILVFLALLLGGSYWFYVTYQEEVPAIPSPSDLAIEKHENIHIFLDASMSMRGYFRTTNEPGSVIQRFMWTSIVQTLREKLQTDRINFATFGDQIRAPKELEPAESLLNTLRFDSRKSKEELFSERETKLVELLSNPSILDARVFVIVTDGVPSSVGQAGVDPRLITNFQALIEDGFHLWLIGLQSEFNGRIFPEMPDAYGKQRSFSYKGQRPVYVWIGSREIDKGAEVTAKYTQDMRSILEPTMAQRVRVIGLTNIQQPMAQVIIKADKFPKVLALKKDNHIELILARGYDKIFAVPLGIKWLNVEWLPEEKHIEWLSSGSGSRGIRIYERNGEWLLEINPKLASSFEIEMQVLPVIEAWWKEWSTDDDSEISNADKTLYLAQLIDSLRSKESYYSAWQQSVIVDK